MIEQILNSVLGKLIADEVLASAPGLTGFILRFALSLVCPWQRLRLSEEWASHLEQTPGTFRKVYEALGLCFAARSIAKAGRIKISEIIDLAQAKFGPELANWLSQEDSKEILGPGANSDMRAALLLEAKRQSSLSENLFQYLDQNWTNLNIERDPRSAADRIIVKMVELFINEGKRRTPATDN